GRELGVEDLYGDVAVMLEIVRQVDRRHPAGAELALDAIVTVNLRRKTTDCLGHVRAVGHCAALRSSSPPSSVSESLSRAVDQASELLVAQRACVAFTRAALCFAAGLALGFDALLLLLAFA